MKNKNKILHFEKYSTNMFPSCPKGPFRRKNLEKNGEWDTTEKSSGIRFHGLKRGQ